MVYIYTVFAIFWHICACSCLHVATPHLQSCLSCLTSSWTQGTQCVRTARRYPLHQTGWHRSVCEREHHWSPLWVHSSHCHCEDYSPRSVKTREREVSIFGMGALNCIMNEIYGMEFLKYGKGALNCMIQWESEIKDQVGCIVTCSSVWPQGDRTWLSPQVALLWREQILVSSSTKSSAVPLPPWNLDNACNYT